MRILHLADLHYRKPWFAWAATQARQHDLVVIAGDLLDMTDCTAESLAVQIKWVQQWIKTFPVSLVVCSGNHDYWDAETRFLDDDAEALWLRSCARSNLFLDGYAGKVGANSLAVLAWGSGHWEADTEIVVVHSPPEGAATARGHEGDNGDFEVAQTIEYRRPRFVLSGHVHHPKNWRARIGRTWSLNPGCDLSATLPNHIVLDTTKAMATFVSETHEAVARLP